MTGKLFQYSLRISLEENSMSQYLQCCYPFVGACHLEIHISIVIFNALPSQTDKSKLESFHPLHQKYRRITFETSKFSSALFCCSGLTVNCSFLSLEIKSFHGQVSDVLVLHPICSVFQ